MNQTAKATTTDSDLIHINNLPRMQEAAYPTSIQDLVHLLLPCRPSPEEIVQKLQAQVKVMLQYDSNHGEFLATIHDQAHACAVQYAVQAVFVNGNSSHYIIEDPSRLSVEGCMMWPGKKDKPVILRHEAFQRSNDLESALADMHQECMMIRNHADPMTAVGIVSISERIVPGEQKCISTIFFWPRPRVAANNTLLNLQHAYKLAKTPLGLNSSTLGWMLQCTPLPDKCFTRAMQRFLHDMVCEKQLSSRGSLLLKHMKEPIWVCVVRQAHIPRSKSPFKMLSMELCEAIFCIALKAWEREEMHLLRVY